jgi:23S rRNA pseudouridine1911/1915/1917 synthase
LSDRNKSWIIAAGAERIRLDQFLVSRISGESRSQIQNWIRKGHIRVNGKQAKTGYPTRLNDRITLEIPETPSDQPFPEDIPLDVLYEDSDLAIINKPAGLVCHIGAGIRSGTLVNALLFRMGPLEAGDPGRPGIVHRLDKLTSGVMLVAKNNLAHRKLSQQFKSRLVKKEYVTLVYGCPTPPSGTIDMPLGRDPKNRKKMSPRAHRKRTAITHYVLEENYAFMSLLGIRIETGRTHQIRVHLSQKGHPIVGDSLYGANQIRSCPAKLSEAIKKLKRPFLHSRRLEFHHPRSGQLLAFDSPLASELDSFLSTIKLLEVRKMKAGPA